MAYFRVTKIVSNVPAPLIRSKHAYHAHNKNVLNPFRKIVPNLKCLLGSRPSFVTRSKQLMLKKRMKKSETEKLNPSADSVSRKRNAKKPKLHKYGFDQKT